MAVHRFAVARAPAQPAPEPDHDPGVRSGAIAGLAGGRTAATGGRSQTSRTTAAGGQPEARAGGRFQWPTCLAPQDVGEGARGGEPEVLPRDKKRVAGIEPA